MRKCELIDTGIYLIELVLSLGMLAVRLCALKTCISEGVTRLLLLHLPPPTFPLLCFAGYILYDVIFADYCCTIFINHIVVVIIEQKQTAK